MQYLFSRYHIYQAKSNKCIMSTKGMITTDLCPDYFKSNSYVLVVLLDMYRGLYTCIYLPIVTLRKPEDLKL